MRFIILYIFTAIFILSCTKPNSQNETVIFSDTTAVLTHQDSIIKLKEDSIANIKVNHKFSVKFQDFEVILDSLEVGEGEKEAYVNFQNISNDTDTTFIVPDVGGYNFEANTFTVKMINSNLTNIRVDQSYETSMFIQGISEKNDEDDPSLDLFPSKKYLSEWKTLRKSLSGKYLTAIYLEDEIGFIHKVTEEDIHGEIMRLDKKKYNYWIKFLNPDYPFALVKIEHYFLRIEGFNNKTKKSFSKIIVIESPSGC